VAKVEDDNLNFEEMNLPDEDLSLPDEEPAQVELADEAATASPVMAEEEAVVEKAEDAEEKKKKDSDKLNFYLICAGAAAIPVLLIVLAFADMILISTALYVICLGLIGFGLWMERKTNTISIVFLGCALAAILTAVYCIWIELRRYNFDIRAREAKERSAMTQPMERGHGLARVERDLT
jgi:hypothetical protein